MRILHLTTFVQGGAGRAITSLATAQARAGHEVSLLTSATGTSGYGNYPEYLDELETAGVAVSAVDSLFDRRPEAHGAVAARLDDALGDPAAGVDILHAHAGTPGALALAAARRSRRRVPVLQTMHGWGIAKTPAQTAADVDVMNTLDRVVVPAESSAVMLRSLGVRPNQLAVVPYGVERVRPRVGADEWVARMRAWRQGGDLVVCCVGTLGERKNQALLVEALAELAPEIPVQAVLVGDGPADTLRALAQARGVSHRVHLVGHRADARRYPREADLLVLPSRSEGQPLAVLEAFCDGVPVIASAIPELAELVAHGRTGWLFAAEDHRALAAAMLHAAQGPEQARAIADHARACYRERFTVDRMVADYMAEYERAS